MPSNKLDQGYNFTETKLDVAGVINISVLEYPISNLVNYHFVIK